MREILFRGKRISNDEWYYGSYLFLHKSPVDWTGAERGKPEDVHYIINDQDINYAVDPSTVGQYTGLTDKNGKRIFEGDIVKCRHGIFEMNADGFADRKIRKGYDKEVEEQELGGFRCYYWRNYAVSFHDGRIRLQNGSDVHYAKWSYIYNHQIEVIGNIHDNPELVEEETT